jgi:cell division septation protein DedD
MRNSEPGEFELVVGNRQLLSGFFIVVLLFAVAFAMGYVVGQNSPRSAKAQVDTASAPPVSLTPSDSRPVASSPAPEPSTATSPVAGGEGAAPPPGTQPARDGEAPAAPAAIPVAPEAAPGSYWQVMAVPQADAEVVARALKEKGFPTSLTQGPNNLIRVLVGPYSDTQGLGRAKTELENAGFRPIRK